MKLKHYMHNGLSFYQTTYCKTTFLALPHIIFNRPVAGKTMLLHLNRNKPIIITELQLNLQKYINICCCKEKTLCCKKSLTQQ